MKVRGLLPNRVNRSLLLLSLGAAALGSASLALLSAVLVLGVTTRHVEESAQRIERELTTRLTSFQPIYTVQRLLQFRTAAGELRQGLVVDWSGRVLAASDQALVGQRITALAQHPPPGSLGPHLRDCRPERLGLACLDQQISLFDGPLPWVGGEHLVRFTPTPLALAGGAGFGRRATLIVDLDLESQLQQAAVLALQVFAAGLVPLFLTSAGLALVVRQRLLPELFRLAQTDALSGVLNRGAFWEVASSRLERACSLGQPVVVALIDVDHFKSINDRFGHAAGDAVIQAMAALLEREVRHTDLLGRLGGDEFALLIAEDPDRARELLDRLRQRVAAAPIALPDGREVPLTLSIGMVASGGHAGEQLQGLLEAADASLYLAKEQGRNRVMDLEGQHPVGWRVSRT